MSNSEKSKLYLDNLFENLGVDYRQVIKSFIEYAKKQVISNEDIYYLCDDYYHLDYYSYLNRMINWYDGYTHTFHLREKEVLVNFQSDILKYLILYYGFDGFVASGNLLQSKEKLKKFIKLRQRLTKIKSLIKDV